MIKHASIVPLIGGETIGSERAFGIQPEYFLSYDVFKEHDSHIVNHYAQRGIDIPYHSLDKGHPFFKTDINVVSSVCPCAGLSQLSTTSKSSNPVNDWMIKTAKYVLEEIKPEVYWGENAPGLFTGMGDGVRERLKKVGDNTGYTMSYYKTKSALHGLSQVRNRSFFFFWKNNKSPTFPFMQRESTQIQDLITNVKSNFQSEPINKKIPTDGYYYRYLLESTKSSSHRDFMQKQMTVMPSRSNDVQSMVEMRDGDFGNIAKWFTSLGLDKQANKALANSDKIKAGGSIMRRDTILPMGIIGAFVGHYPMMLAHPIEDRYISYREAMTIMGLPDDFELLNPHKNVNHICQNVPVKTAQDMAEFVKIALETPDKFEWSTGETYTNNVSRTNKVLNYH